MMIRVWWGLLSMGCFFLWVLGWGFVVWCSVVFVMMFGN